MAATPAKPPEEVPAAIKEDVAKLRKPLAAILVGKEIPWVIQAALGASGYVTVWRIAGTPRLRPGTMVPGTWDSRMERMDSTPRPWPSRPCASFRQYGWQQTWSGGATRVTTRRAMEFQGSDGYLKKQWRMIGKGELG